jgi:hypothetical protein
MAETLESLQTRLQQANIEYARKLQQTSDSWLKQYADLNNEYLKTHQEVFAAMQEHWQEITTASCAAPVSEKK